VARAEKELRQFALAKNSLQLAESEERDKHHEHEHGQSQNSLQGAPTKVSNTLGERLPMEEADSGILQNLATRQYERKQGRLQDSRVDERCIAACIAQVESSAETH